jgi:CubicO group peptidase (beta-lactamase class C family)
MIREWIAIIPGISRFWSLFLPGGLVYYTKFRTHLFPILILVGLLFSFRPAANALAGRDLHSTSVQEKIDAYLQSRMRIANIPGLALGVVSGDQVVYLKGYGIAGPDGRAVTPQTPFIIGSSSKSFTALAVMQLVEAGQIDLDAPVTSYLPWFRTADITASNQITVRNLLNQDSGMGVYAGRQGMADNDQSSTALEQGVRQLAALQLSHPAGQAYEYSNVNYTLLGLIVQTVSQKPYEDYVASEIFAPLHMTRSAAATTDTAAKDIASGHRYWFFWPVAYDAPYPRRLTPAGYLISTAEDMSHYLIAQLNGGAYDKQQVLSPSGIDALHSPGAKMGPSSSYGMGWIVRGQPGSRKIEHTGDSSNFHSNMLLLPDQQLGIVILINVSGYSQINAINIPIEGVAALLLGQDLTAAVDPPANWVSPLIPLVPLFILVVWIAGSYLFIQRWRRQKKLPPRGLPRLWRYFLPLAIDLILASIAWIFVPLQFLTPIETIGLFTPDVFLIVVLMTVLGVGWALTRTYLTFHPSQV